MQQVELCDRIWGCGVVEAGGTEEEKSEDEILLLEY